ncbi:hypothetical protein K8B33_15670 [Alcanivorax sp. JB21]|uniref:hypothetical protein n=1 Tax=Alcanivorax limicola TaxID=2874102 RepID=UPI001CBDC5B7|nr:hypothetical protein [Alcanivorax limicola]MBZ2190548.1 hypothetical protein [Alcanivorax limicola]
MRTAILVSSAMLAFQAHAEELFALNAGAEWFYEMEGGEAPEAVVRIDETRSVHGVVWYRLDEFGDVFWVRNGDGGQIEAVEAGDNGPDEKRFYEEVLVFRYPAEPGERWELFDTEFTYQGLRPVDVPAGRFDCHAYHLDMGDGRYALSCFVPKIGLVYSESVLDDGEKTVARLVRFDISPEQ